MSTYVSSSALKATLSITGTAFDADISAALEAASRDIENVCDRVFTLTSDNTAIRYYTPVYGSLILPIDDAVSVTEVALDTAGNSTFSQTLTEHTDYELLEYNAASIGWPYTALELRPTATAYWPCYPRSVRVTGQFGWSATPGPVIDACTILASRLFKRRREAPFGIVTAGIDSGVAMRIARTDPDVYHLLEPYMTAGTPAL